MPGIPSGGCRRILFAVRSHEIVPISFLLLKLIPQGCEMLFNFRRYVKKRLKRPAQVFPGQKDLPGTQGGAVGFGLPLFMRRTVAYLCAHPDQDRPIAFPGPFYCSANLINIITILYLQHPPAISFKALSHIFGESNIRAAVNSHPVIIIKADQLVQL